MRKKKKNSRKHKFLETKYVTKQPMDRWRTQRGNQKIFKDKWQWRYDNLWTVYGTQAKAVLKGKFTAIHCYLRKQEKSQINKLTLHLEYLEKEEWTKPKISRRKEIVNIRAEINEIETKKTIEILQVGGMARWQKSKRRWSPSPTNTSKQHIYM